VESKRLTEDPNAISYGGVARSEFRDGDVLCFRGRGPMGLLIRRLTRSPYSHVGLTYRFEGRVYCLEAVGAGVRLVLMSQLMKRYKGGIDYYAVDAQAPVRRRAVSWCFTQLGKLYDTAGIARFGWTLVSGNASRARRDDQWFCSELVAAAFSEAGLRLVEHAADYTTPEHLVRSASLEKRFTLKP
jgi:uncharacterized protein YycO